MQHSARTLAAQVNADKGFVVADVTVLESVVDARYPMTAWEPLCEDERSLFQREGYVLIKNAIDTKSDLYESVSAAADELYRREEAAGKLWQGGQLHLQAAIAQDPAFVELLTHGPSFRWVWGLLGWNIFTHHNHLDINPPLPEKHKPRQVWAWHQDGWRQNSDSEYRVEDYEVAIPRPQFSIKVAFMLSDLTEPGQGGTLLLPKSHLRNTLPRPKDPQVFDHPKGAVHVTGSTGDVLIFDRRLWHSKSPNTSQITRRSLFIGFTHRWIRPLDEFVIDTESTWWENLSPLTRQLLGEGDSKADFWGIHEVGGINDQIPLRHELLKRNLINPEIPWLR